MHGVGIGHDQRVGRARGLELNAGVDHDAADGVDRILKQNAGADRLQGELVVGAFDAGEGEQILGEAIHAAGVFENDAKEFECGFGAGMRIFDQRFDVALDGSERSAQLVADVGDEFAAGFLRGLDAGDVVQHDQRAARGQRRGVDLKDAAGSKQAGAAHAELAALERAANAGQQFRIADEVDERPAGSNLRSGNALHDGVGPADEARRCDGDDRFLHGVEHDGQLVAAAFELGKVPAEPDRGLIERSFHRRELGDSAERDRWWYRGR